MRVFREFLKRKVVNGKEMIDASQVVSRECYDLWVSTRKALPPNPEKAFQRALSAHITGVDGRVAFTPSEEHAILKVLRKKERWPCFETSSTRFGLMGFRAKGFHEKSLPGGGDDMSTGKRFKEGHDSDDDDADNNGSEEGTASGGSHSGSSDSAYGKSAWDVIANARMGTTLNPFLGAGANALNPQATFAHSLLLPQHAMGGSAIPTNPFSAANQFGQASIPNHLPSTNPLLSQPSSTAALLAASAIGGATNVSRSITSGVPTPKKTFLETAATLCNQTMLTGVNFLGTILSMARMTMLSMNFQSPLNARENAARLLREQQELHMDQAIAVVDLTARDAADRVLAVNNVCESLFGDLPRKGAQQDYLVPPHELWKVLSSTYAAHENPNQPISLQTTLLTLQGAREAHIVVTHCPSERLLLVRASL